MRVRRVEILRSPGIDPGFEMPPSGKVGFDDGLTIIEGRNESGKSTLARAIRALLWPARHQSLQARGVFEDNGKEHHSFVDLHGGGWQGEAPRLPDSAAGRGIIVGIGDLWIEDDHDHSILQAMQRELQGGYDLGQLWASAERKSPTAPMRAARDAERSLSQARNRTRSLMTQEATLPDLRDRAERLRQEAARGGLLTRALERLRVAEDLAGLREQLGRIPPGALRVSGNEARRMNELRDAMADASAAVEREERQAAEAESAARSLGLPEAGVGEGDLHLLAQLASEAEALERQISDAQRAAVRVEAEANAIEANGRAMDAQTLARLDEALDAVQQARERRNHDRELAEREPAPPAAATHRGLLFAAAIFALAAAAAAAVVAAWIALGLGLVAAACAVAAALRNPQTVVDNAPARRERAELSERLYEQTLARLREVAGDDPELQSTLSLVTAARRAERQDRLVRELHGARAGVEALEAQRDRVLDRAADTVARHAGGPCATPDALSRSLADMKHRASEHRRLRQARAEALARAAEASARRDRVASDYATFLESLGLSEDRLGELQEWLRRREAAQALAEKIRANEALLAKLDSALAGSSELLELDEAALSQRLASCETAAREADGVYQQIGGIERAIEEARSSADVGRALGDYERAAEEVARVRDAECAKAARQLILDHALSGMERQDMPALLRSADELMSMFTSRAYGLSVNAQSQPVLRDERAGVVRPYDQLSTGTRAQALLAMRLAGALDAERRAGSTPMPLVLDEPLATTDDERFEAIAKALFDLAEGGRQLIYLTCEPAHALRLQRLAGERGLDCTRHDLDAIRRRQRTRRVPAAALVEPKTTPSPKTMTREGYLDARGVDALDPWADEAAIDLFHLFPGDLETLHDLSMHGLKTAGQVLRARQRQGEGFAWPQAAERAECAVRLLRAWRRGRARPLTTRDLVESGAVSEKFLQRLAEVNRELGGSADALLAAIEAKNDDRVKGFRSDKARALRDYLESQALLPTGEPLTNAEVLGEALGAGREAMSDHDPNETLRALHGVLAQLDARERKDREALPALEA